MAAPRFRAAIVDLDGTMVDTLGDFEVALNRTLADLDLPGVSRALVERTVGKGSEHLIRSVLTHQLTLPEVQACAGRSADALYQPAWARYQHHYRQINGAHSQVYPGVTEGLQALQAMGWALACLCATLWPWGITSAQELVLQPSDRLTERLSPEAQRAAPTFVSGDRITGQTGVNTVVEGQAELRRHDTIIRADRLEHDTASDTAKAQGQVRINRLGNVFEGPSLTLKLDTFEGEFEQPRFEFLKQGGQGDASRIEFINEDVAVAHDVRYSTCQRPPLGAWTPDWMVTASRIEFDNVEETGTATNGVLRFKGVPLLASPWISFPLSDRRKSGVLPPTINIDNQSGLELTVPYYLNLAPNRDATLYPTLMTKRGLDLGGEYRYLERDYGGTLRGAYMASDRLRDRDRWSASIQHVQGLDGIAGSSPIGLRANINRVSDDNYWRDFPRSGSTFTQRLLPSEVALNSRLDEWQLQGGVYAWQTLQDTSAPIVAPYDRAQLTASRTPYALSLGALGTWSAQISADVTRFDSPDVAIQTNGANGTRSLAVARLERLWQAPGWFVKPGLQLHARHYSFDAALSDGRRSASYLLPTLSLDTGLVFERDTQLFGKAAIQTLEPRVFYTRTPRRTQSALPVYDTALYDFNLASVFTSNPYSGHDRMADLHAITTGLTSRLIDAESGAELASIGVAQRRRLSDQTVNLGETSASQRDSDLLFGASLNWSAQWALNGTLQYSTELRESVRTTLGMRYQPGPYRVLSAAYRLQRNVTPESEQIDLAWQWPLSDLFGRPATRTPGTQALGAGQWYSVGRINYSIPDRKVVDLVAGFEYDGGCWIGRVVLARLQQSRSTANQSILFQLEFTGFSRIGSNPLQTLRNNIPRYQYLREEVNPPSRFERYE